LPKGLQRCSHSSLYICPNPYVGGNGDRLPPGVINCLRCFFSMGRGLAGCDHPRALSAHHLSDASANAAPSPGDERYLIF
jgi:hypothetical protein